MGRRKKKEPMEPKHDVAAEESNKMGVFRLSSSSPGEEHEAGRNSRCFDGNVVEMSAPSSADSSSDQSDRLAFLDDNVDTTTGHNNRRKAKKMTAGMGTVSSVLGKDYVTSISRGGSERDHGRNLKKHMVNGEDTEQFLCSMLGDESHLNMAVVRDVLWHCGYDFEKALNSLLKLCGAPSSAAESVQQCSDPYAECCREEEVSDTTYDSSDGDQTALDNFSWDLNDSGSKNNGRRRRSYVEVLCGSCGGEESSPRKTEMSDVPFDVLDSLFNFRKRCGEDDPTTEWTNMVSHLESLGKYNPPSRAGGDEYAVLRKDAAGHRELVKRFYERAAEAYSRGEHSVAAHLSGEGRDRRGMAIAADERASRDIFTIRNRSIENTVTIDLHGQHVSEAIAIVKIHILFGTRLSSIRYLRAITGTDARSGVGKSKLKPSVVELLKREQMQWVEENPGTLLITLPS